MTDGWPDERREVAYTEARTVIDAQNATMTDIDDKAMRTVRFNAVLIGLLLSGFQIAPNLFDQTAFRTAFALLIVSTVCGVVTYNESNLYVGPGGEYIEALVGDDVPDPSWSDGFIETMAGMIAKNYDVLRRNSNWLTVTQIALVLGIVAAVTALAI